ncbi:hypothetical protein ElyMa_004925400 [Elysia marginata]|uniref:Helix-turn-helix domain-containing protein n=1 Tax=Elysia marginata TaxID=1093978 RepID=A0AAV4IZW2_9GAST|nr:hypothetical protein ElyMa_004925400 [Elysia marginata]
MVSLQNNTLHTDLDSKPTDTFDYLHWSSCHPFHTKSNIPYSLAFRLIRICSCEETLTRRLTELTEHLKRPEGHTQSQRNTKIYSHTETPLARDTKKKNRIPFVITYNPALPNISSTLKKYFPILHTSPRCRRAIPHLPMAAFRRPKNLRDSLVHANIQKHTYVAKTV